MKFTLDKRSLHNRGEVYAFINIIEKKVYVGETGDGENRELTHAKCIFGLEKGSNEKMIDDNQKNYYCLMYLCSFPTKDKDNTEQLWIALETVYMYLFVKYGFQLYNTNKGKDNTGGKRKFLVNNLPKDKLYKNTLDFLNNYPIKNVQFCNEISSEILSNNNWAELLKEIEEIFKKDIFNVFQCKITDIVECENRNELWRKFVESKRKDKNFIILDHMESEKDFFVFNKNKLEESGMKSISLKDLLKNNKLNHIIYSKVGDYLGETTYQILQNKILDLQCNISLDILGAHESACFWSLAGKQESWIRKELVEKEGKKDIYLILSYTGSKNISGRLPQITKVKQYALDRKRKTTKYDYPNEYEDELISNRNSMSFLISELYYAKESITGTIIEETYTALFENYANNNTQKKIKYCYKQKPFYLAELKEEDKNSFSSVINKANIESNKTGLLIAKLVYPFVVAVNQ